jgi:hypothetical protein
MEYKEGFFCQQRILTLRSAPAQNIPGEVDLRMTTRALLSNLKASTALISSITRFLLNEFFA